jgi:uncharacterized protein (DUF885 family)
MSRTLRTTRTLRSMLSLRATPWALALPLLAACGSGAPVAVPPATEVPAMPPAPAGAAATAPRPSDDAAIAQAVKDYIRLVVDISPETATALGDHSRDTDLDSYTLDGDEAGVKREEAMLADLEARFTSPQASRASRTDLAVVEGALAVDVKRRRTIKPLERDPDEYIAPMNAIFLQSAREYAPAADRAQASLARIEKIPAVLAPAKSNLKACPKIWAGVALEQARTAGAFFDGERGFLIAALPDQKTRIDAALGAAKKAYADFAKLLEQQVLPHGTADFAAGRGLFEFLLREGYFLDETPDALFDMGKKVFDETQTEMDTVAKRIDPKAKGWPDVTRVLKGHHPTAADLIPSYRREVERARKFLADKDVVPFPPGDDCQVEETPLFLRNVTTASYEVAPPLDPVTRGFFYVTPVEPSMSAAEKEQMLRENDHGDEVDTVVHETYPGHHLQLSFSRGYPSLIRKLSDAKRALVPGSNLFAEGWGLYAEELMGELGYYTDEERLLQLEWTLVRAARVMIDVGLHTRGMSFDDAVKILTDQVHLEKALAVSEVKRYTMSPTQPLSYLVGREEIRAMRDKYKARAGAAYSLKAFHTELLSHGTIAQGLVEKEMFGD